MKRLFTKKEGQNKVSGLEFLSVGELLHVRGGSDIKPASRPKDIFDLEQD